MGFFRSRALKFIFEAANFKKLTWIILGLIVLLIASLVHYSPPAQAVSAYKVIAWGDPTSGQINGCIVKILCKEWWVDLTSK